MLYILMHIFVDKRFTFVTKVLAPKERELNFICFGDENINFIGKSCQYSSLSNKFGIL